MSVLRLFLVVVLTTIATAPSYCQFAKTSNGSSAFDSSGEVLPSYGRFTIGYDALFAGGDYAEALNDDDAITASGITIKFIKGWALSKQNPVYFEAGLRLNANFWSRHLKIDNYYDHSGSKTDTELSMKMLSISVPLNVTYRFAVDKKVSFQPYTGFNLKVNALGKIKFLGEECNAFDKDDMGKDAKWERVQVGWQIGLGLNINIFYLGIEYGLDFKELSKELDTSHLEVAIGANF